MTAVREELVQAKEKEETLNQEVWQLNLKLMNARVSQIPVSDASTF